jgi:hypothetical protein
LHSTIEAVAPGLKPVPATVMTSLPARPVQMGSKTLELLQVAPAAVVVSDRVVPGVLTVDAYTDVPSNAPPATTVKMPIAAIKFGVSLRLAATTVLPDLRTPRQSLFAIDAA